MDIAGEYRIPAAREAVWAALNDPDVLARCIPGCRELVQVSPEEMKAKVALKIGPVSAAFMGTVRLEDVRPPEGYSLIGQGNGGMAGFAKGRAAVTLAAEGGETVLAYTAKAEVGGKIATLGGRLMQATSRKLADEFFSKFAAEFGASGDSAGSMPAPA
ncbi:carbon monoxide dehydrogenase subunit G [Methylobacterium mesophilicum SR1.6/6]|uniref:Carbon monoxide dehydrogenase subunit G n=1 Tax=Methylobacterium mesophilicum SR1.6/6 TaxID=908290 RepID=A0A6B9FKM1_9HYPH|nr:carbon monoxide dehydrogenase subunit G [Methylobacterium mesophilicum]QGY02489.1 carbon monoxide dehydrogenase subunit G [Methylobacterium mesophilicum SR1.6/6]